MHSTWILDVLTDLKTFASMNGLNALASELDKTQRVASEELETFIERPVIGSDSSTRGRRPQPSRVGTRFRA